MSELQKIYAEVAATRADVRWIKQTLADGAGKLEKHDERISSLERWRTWLAGAGAVIAGFFGISHAKL